MHSSPMSTAYTEKAPEPKKPMATDTSMAMNIKTATGGYKSPALEAFAKMPKMK